MFAIVNGVETNHKAIAVCRKRSYDVLGNAKDGYEVNDVFDRGTVEIEVTAEVSNFPAYPGAKDDYRSFPQSGSFSAQIVVSFCLADKDIKRALSIECEIEVGGDDMYYEVNRASDGYPLGELTIESWKPVN